MHARVEVRQQPGLLEHEPRSAAEVLERRIAAESGKLLTRDPVPQLRLVTEREQRLVAPGLRARPRDRHHLVLAHERPLPTPRRPCERAVVADVAAKRGQRNEDLRRVRDEIAVTTLAQLSSRGAEVADGRIHEHACGVRRHSLAGQRSVQGVSPAALHRVSLGEPGRARVVFGGCGSARQRARQRACASLPKARQRPFRQRCSCACSIGNRSVAPVFTRMPGSVNGFLKFRRATARRTPARVRLRPALRRVSAIA